MPKSRTSGGTAPDCDGLELEWLEYALAENEWRQYYEQAWQDAVDGYRGAMAAQNLTRLYPDSEAAWEAFYEAINTSDVANANLESASTNWRAEKELECQYRQDYIDCLEGD